MLDQELNFKSDEELGKIPENTEAVVQVRAEKGRELGDFRTGEGEYGPWMSIPVEVVEGPYKGTYASLMLTVDPEDYKFRNVFRLATDIDISKGGKVPLSAFVEGMVSGRFKAVLSPDKRNPRYTRVVKVLEKVGDRVESSSGAGGDGGEVLDVDDVHDEDIPF